MNVAVIFAGGVGKRMHSKDLPKQFLKLHDKPIIIHTLEVFENNANIDSIVIACVEDWIPYLQELIIKYNINKVLKIVPGGSTGQLSIYNGLSVVHELYKNNEDTIVLIHDGVRPLIDDKTIDDNITSVKEHGSAITSVAVTETVLLTNNDSSIESIPDRSCSRLARAPQSFRLHEVWEAESRAISEGKTDFIDTCSLMKYYGYHLYLIEGPKQNIKITTPEDFYVMRAMIDARENLQMLGSNE